MKNNLKKINILQITPWFPLTVNSSGNQYMYDDFSVLKEKVNLTVLFFRPYKPKFYLKLNNSCFCKSDFNTLNINEVNYFQFPRHLFFYDSYDKISTFFIKKRVLSLIQKENISIIHVHTEQIAFIIYEIVKNLNIPYIVTIHAWNQDPKLFNSGKRIQRFRRVMLNASHITLAGSAMLKFLEKYKANSTKVSIINNGFKIDQAPKNLNEILIQEEIRFCSVSHLYESKGIWLNIEALTDLYFNHGYRNWRYYIVGDGILRESIHKHIKDLQLQDNIFLLGAKSRIEAHKLMKGCDVHLMPSRNESFGLATIEAMALGLLSIGVIGQGPSDYIIHNENGVLINFIKQELIDLILDIRDNRGKYQQIAIRALQIRDELSWDRHSEHLINIYNDMLS